jgi:hypothetical protein
MGIQPYFGWKSPILARSTQIRPDPPPQHRDCRVTAMAARIVSHAALQAAAPAPSLGLPEEAHARRQVWRGASGKRYAHSVYSLIACPPLPAASYILVRRDRHGRRTALRVGLGRSDAPTLNLARVRQRGAQLGANEVHVHFQAASHDERRLVACDLRAGLFGTLSAEPPGTRVR